MERIKGLIGWCMGYCAVGKESVAPAYKNPPFSSAFDSLTGLEIGDLERDLINVPLHTSVSVSFYGEFHDLEKSYGWHTNFVIHFDSLSLKMSAIQHSATLAPH